MRGDGESRARTDVCRGHEFDGYVPDKRVYARASLGARHKDCLFLQKKEKVKRMI